MSNINKLAKSLAKNANQAGYVTLDQESFAKIKAALEVARSLATVHPDDGKLLEISNAGLEAVNTLTRPMPLGHAYDILARMNGLKDFNSLAAVLPGAANTQEKLEQVRELDGSTDYLMSPAAEDSRLWIEVNSFSVHIKRTHEGVIVDLFATGCEDEGSLGSAALEWVDAEEAMRKAGRGWLIYSANEAADGNGAGFWSNEMGWCYEEEASVFTAAEKERYSLPISQGQDAQWVSLSDTSQLWPSHYLVSLAEAGKTDTTVFACQAEDLERARKKAESAYPGCTVRSVQLDDTHRPGAGYTPCEYCGEVDCDYSCDESQAGGFQESETQAAAVDGNPDKP